MAKRKRGEPEELIGEVIEAPGVKVHGPPVAVVVEEAPPPAFAPLLLAVPPEVQQAIGRIEVPANVAAVVREWAPRVRDGVTVVRAVAAELTGLRDALAPLFAAARPAAPARRRRRAR